MRIGLLEDTKLLCPFEVLGIPKADISNVALDVFLPSQVNGMAADLGRVIPEIEQDSPCAFKKGRCQILEGHLHRIKVLETVN